MVMEYLVMMMKALTPNPSATRAVAVQTNATESALATTEPTTPPTPPTLLTLPTELRLQIYAHLFASLRQLLINTESLLGDWDFAPAILPALLRTNRLLRAEATEPYVAHLETLHAPLRNLLCKAYTPYCKPASTPARVIQRNHWRVESVFVWQERVHALIESFSDAAALARDVDDRGVEEAAESLVGQVDGGDSVVEKDGWVTDTTQSPLGIGP